SWPSRSTHPPMQERPMAHEAEAVEVHAGEHAHAPQAFIWKYVFSKDHKVIGIQYYLAAMVMGLIAGLLAMLIRLQLGWPEGNFAFLGRLLPIGYDVTPGVGGVMKPEFY